MMDLVVMRGVAKAVCTIEVDENVTRHIQNDRRRPKHRNTSASRNCFRICAPNCITSLHGQPAGKNWSCMPHIHHDFVLAYDGYHS